MRAHSGTVLGVLHRTSDGIGATLRQSAFVFQRVANMRSELNASFEKTCRDRQAFVESLATIDRLRVFPSQTNFVFAELDPGVSGRALRDALLEQHGCFIRECSNKRGSSQRYLRLAVNLPAENEILVNALQMLLAKWTI